MSMKYIRDYYKVPAKRGAKIRYMASDGDDCDGVITSSKDQYLRVRFGNDKRTVLLHPTWNVAYLNEKNEVILKFVNDREEGRE